ncbi:protein BONZAI 1-like isoform X1 [Cucumis melo var. makuwa]|uniref:Protein BONZAI 1-like isoform X1 n=1 Tax=Cucumis melo var. makuwa TaxID=1194695 RepID=A0A5A7UQX3_CUCMM|nr:protein BONZAI 1-like isoform X1 [Cucumis melo var. makuwa]
MGNCFSNEAAGQSSIGGTAFFQSTTSNVAIDCFLLSRGYRGLYSQIECPHPLLSVAVSNWVVLSSRPSNSFHLPISSPILMAAFILCIQLPRLRYIL